MNREQLAAEHANGITPTGTPNEALNTINGHWWDMARDSYLAGFDAGVKHAEEWVDGFRETIKAALGNALDQMDETENYHKAYDGMEQAYRYCLEMLKKHIELKNTLPPKPTEKL